MRSPVSRVAPARTHVAAIQTSFDGTGRRSTRRDPAGYPGFTALEIAVGYAAKTVAAHFHKSRSISSKLRIADRDSSCSASVQAPASRPTPLLRVLLTPRLCRSRSITVWFNDLPRRCFSRSRAAANSLGGLRTVTWMHSCYALSECVLLKSNADWCG